MIEAFKVFDFDRNGLISIEDLKVVMKQIGESLSTDECTEIIRSGSANGGDYLTYDEFIVMMVPTGKEKYSTQRE